MAVCIPRGATAASDGSIGRATRGTSPPRPGGYCRRPGGGPPGGRAACRATRVSLLLPAGPPPAGMHSDCEEIRSCHGRSDCSLSLPFHLLLSFRISSLPATEYMCSAAVGLVVTPPTHPPCSAVRGSSCVDADPAAPVHPLCTGGQDSPVSSPRA